MKRLFLILGTFLLASCSLGVPMATPTVAPTLTPVDTAVPTITVTNTPSLTPTITQTLVVIAPTDTASPLPTASETPPPTTTAPPTQTPQPTDTGTLTPTQTPTPTDTIEPSPTSTATETPTPLPTATFTPTETQPPSPTPLPTIGETPTPSPTHTPLPTLTPSPTDTRPPTLTPLPTLTNTVPPTLTPIPTWTLPPPTLTPPPTFTHTPQQIAPDAVAPIGVRSPTPEPASPTPAITVPPPTQDATPTFVTAPPDFVGTVELTATPEIGEAPPEPASPTPIPQPPTAEQVIIDPVGLVTPASIAPLNPDTLAFALSTEGGLSGGPIGLLDRAVTFARDPNNPNRYAVVDPNGALYFNDLAAGSSARVQFSPFSEFPPASAETNNARVVQVAWSPDSRYLAFHVRSDMDTPNNGVWFYDVGAGQINEFAPTYQLVRDCPPQAGCDLIAPDTAPRGLQTVSFAWNLQNTAILVRLVLPEEGNRAAFTVVQPAADTNYARVRQTVYRYDHASWSQDGSRVLVSGMGADGVVALRWIDPATGAESIIFNGSAAGLWLQNAVEGANGQVYALGSPNGANSAMRLYDASGNAISDVIGTAAPARVAWSPDRTAILVVTNERINEQDNRRYFVTQVGEFAPREITEQVAGALAVEWVQNDTPVEDALQPTSTPIPTQAGQFTVGQQVLVSAPAGVYLRPEPFVVENAVVPHLLAETRLTIIGGPVDAEGYRWWNVQTVDGLTGWVVESVAGISTLQAG